MYEDITIRQFMKAMFKGDRSVMTEDQFALCLDEYIDTADLYEKEDFQKSSYLEYLKGRINTVKISIDLQRKYLREFGIPYLPGLAKFKKFGYIVTWKNEQDFIKQIKKVEKAERKFVSQAEGKYKELQDYRKSKKSQKPDKQTDVKVERGSFIRTINSLGKVGYKIDNDKTTVEELAYMIKQQTDEIKK